MFLTFLSDLGYEDAFLGVCKGVIARIAPDVTVIDVLHLVAVQDIGQGAGVLASAVPYLPAPAVHLALVDPFRTAAGRGIAVRTADGSTFVAPDNGLTSQAWDVAGGVVSAHVLDDRSLWLPDAGPHLPGPRRLLARSPPGSPPACRSSRSAPRSPRPTSSASRSARRRSTTTTCTPRSCRSTTSATSRSTSSAPTSRPPASCSATTSRCAAAARR